MKKMKTRWWSSGDEEVAAAAVDIGDGGLVEEAQCILAVAAK